jgi:hypothetical protein
MKKLEKMESLKGYALSAQATSKLDGGYLETKGGSFSSGTTFQSDTVRSVAMGDSEDKILYHNTTLSSDAPIINNGDSRTDVLPVLSIDLIGVTAIESQPISDIGSMSFLLS